jgi:hypothetical protein
MVDDFHLIPNNSIIEARLSEPRGDMAHETADRSNHAPITEQEVNAA